jgi:hypothetical protein
MPFDGIRKLHLERVAAELYSDQMPYHSFSHVLGTLAAGAMLVDHCLKEGLPINAEAVYYALLFHDAGYYQQGLYEQGRVFCLPRRSMLACRNYS